MWGYTNSRYYILKSADKPVHIFINFITSFYSNLVGKAANMMILIDKKALRRKKKTGFFTKFALNIQILSR